MIKRITLFLATLCLLAACKPEPRFQLMSQDKVDLPQVGGSFTLVVDANIDFTVNIPADASSWLRKTLSEEGETHKITLSAETNTDVHARKTVVTISSEIGKADVTVSQLGENPALVISSFIVDAPTLGRDFDVRVTTNLSIEIEVLPASCDWVKLVKSKTVSSHTYSFEVAANNTGEAREMSLVFKNEEFDSSDTVKVKQGYLPSFTFSTAKQEVTAPWLEKPAEGARIFWGDGSYEPYVQGVKHRYAQPGEYTIIVEGGAPLYAPVRVTEFEEGMVLDFSYINYKEAEK